MDKTVWKNANIKRYSFISKSASSNPALTNTIKIENIKINAEVTDVSISGTTFRLYGYCQSIWKSVKLTVTINNKIVYEKESISTSQLGNRHSVSTNISIDVLFTDKINEISLVAARK